MGQKVFYDASVETLRPFKFRLDPFCVGSVLGGPFSHLGNRKSLLWKYFCGEIYHKKLGVVELHNMRAMGNDSFVSRVKITPSYNYN